MSIPQVKVQKQIQIDLNELQLAPKNWSEEIACDIKIYLNSQLPAEGYQLIISDSPALIVSDYAGAYYGWITLKNFQLPKDVVIFDYPEFSWRGVHLDVARHFFTVTEVKKFIELISMHKLNKLHLHLNDDQGWRVEIPDWPLLTKIGAWRAGSPIGHEIDNLGSDGIPHGGFYSKAQLLEIADHARKHAVTIVPEIDLPGHAQAVLAAYPDLGNTNEDIKVWEHWGISEYVLSPTQKSLEFAKSVISYVADIFPNSPFHIGGDECPTTQWEVSEIAKNVMQEKSLKNFQELQSIFTEALTKSLIAKGHKVLAWDEVMESGAAKDVVIVAWRDYEKVVEAVNSNYQTIVAPMQRLYFDWAQSPEENEPISQTSRYQPTIYTTWEDVYNFEIVGKEIAKNKKEFILGSQVQLWTEYIKNWDQLMYMAIPRLCAFSEIVWGNQKDISSFKNRLIEHLKQHQSDKVSYRKIS